MKILQTSVLGFLASTDALRIKAQQRRGHLLSGFPALSEEGRVNADAFHAHMELLAHQTGEQVMSRKTSAGGTDLGPYFSLEAQQKVGAVLTAFAPRLYRRIAGEYASSSVPEPADFFEKLAETVLLDALRVYRDVLAGAWLSRLGEKDDSLEPDIVPVASTIIDRLEPIRRRATLEAIKLKASNTATEPIEEAFSEQALAERRQHLIESYRCRAEAIDSETKLAHLYQESGRPKRYEGVKGLWKPQWQEYVSGRLPDTSTTAKNIDRFLEAGIPPKRLS